MGPGPSRTPRRLARPLRTQRSARCKGRRGRAAWARGEADSGQTQGRGSSGRRAGAGQWYILPFGRRRRRRSRLMTSPEGFGHRRTRHFRRLGPIPDLRLGLRLARSRSDAPRRFRLRGIRPVLISRSLGPRTMSIGTPILYHPRPAPRAQCGSSPVPRAAGGRCGPAPRRAAARGPAGRLRPAGPMIGPAGRPAPPPPHRHRRRRRASATRVGARSGRQPQTPSDLSPHSSTPSSRAQRLPVTLRVDR